MSANIWSIKLVVKVVFAFKVLVMSNDRFVFQNPAVSMLEMFSVADPAASPVSVSVQLDALFQDTSAVAAEEKFCLLLTAKGITPNDVEAAELTAPSSQSPVGLYEVFATVNVVLPSEAAVYAFMDDLAASNIGCVSKTTEKLKALIEL